MDQKIAYSRRPGPRPLYDGDSMMMCLIMYRPHFLQIEEKWVEILLKAEMYIKSNYGENCLKLLFQNKNANKFCSGKYFDMLLENLIDDNDKYNHTVLMSLC